MFEEIYIKIPGKPIAKKTQRDRVQVNVDWINKKYDVKRWRFYPQAAEANEVKRQIEAQYSGDLIDDAVFVRFIFHMPIPKNWSKRQKTMALDGRILPIGKPDASNLTKFYEDCMKGIIYTDDARIIWPCPIKQYDEDPSTEIYITPFRYEDYQRFQGLAS